MEAIKYASISVHLSTSLAIVTIITVSSPPALEVATNDKVGRMQSNPLTVHINSPIPCEPSGSVPT